MNKEYKEYEEFKEYKNTGVRRSFTNGQQRSRRLTPSGSLNSSDSLYSLFISTRRGGATTGMGRSGADRLGNLPRFLGGRRELGRGKSRRSRALRHHGYRQSKCDKLFCRREGRH